MPQISNYFILQGGFIPLRLSQTPIFETGEGFLIPPLLTLFTSTFLHGGFFHLLMNMLLLGIIGGIVENITGTRKFLLIYFCGAFAGCLAEFAVNPMSDLPIIGASGGISAIIAVQMMLMPAKAITPWGGLSVYWTRFIQLTLLWAILNFGMMLFLSDMNIAVYAHMGAFIAGLLSVKLLK
ncbi:rhomboid family intramembrane serine protease [Sphingorhabdus lutea]|uniref:rhomboid family intramembrane serine protease n=1 Tax=Sphingorhabdus lutea TaxID=1913578 RepID=UPI0018DDCFD9|nr:rhomboid family intramembrane serine protease [Sphingorhabdus lutea]